MCRNLWKELRNRAKWPRLWRTLRVSTTSVSGHVREGYLNEEKINENEKQSAQYHRENKAFVVGSSDIGDQGCLECLVTGLSWDGTWSAVESARIKAPDTLVATREDKVDDIRNDGWKFREGTLLAIQDEVLVLAAQDEW
jgi:hypothetical protein